MFTIDNTVLILIDVQGKLAEMMYKRDKLFDSLKTILTGMSILKVPVIWMEQIPDKLGPTSQEILELMHELMPGVNPIPKHTFSCCANETFMDAFNGLNRKQVLLSGIESHICVYQTAMDLIRSGCEVQVLADCVSSRTKLNRKAGIDRIQQAGGAVTTCEMILFELMKAAEGEAFRKVVKFIK